tara:strand:+ start:1563 stop:1976 length:414 start_codon:yes stop_codon:yes gene_type:complete
MPIYKMYHTDDNYINTEAVGMCLFYKQLYLRQKRWFGYSYPFWLCDMDEGHLLKNILRMVVPDSMYILFVNVSIRIRKKHGRSIDLLEKYKVDHPNPKKQQTKRQYYLNNIEKFRQYSKNHYLLKNTRINIFKKNIS